MIAALPSWMDAQFLRSASGALVVAAALGVLALLFVLRSLSVKIVSLLLVGAAVFGLVHYRHTLERCDAHGCACKLLGQSVPAEHCRAG